VIQHEREDARSGKLDESKQRYCQKTAARTLADVVVGCDVFPGLLDRGRADAEMVGTMAARPIILALANPEPEIRPELAKQARPDASSRPAARTIRTRSTTSSAFPTSSAARSTAARPASPRR
jgi:malic enzyme